MAPAGTQGRPAVLLPPLNMSHNAWTQQSRFCGGTDMRRTFQSIPAISITGCMEGRSIPRRWSTRSSTTSGASSGARRADAGGRWAAAFSLGRRREMAAAHLAMVLVTPRLGSTATSSARNHRPTPRTRSQCRLPRHRAQAGSNIVDQVGAGATMDVLQHYYGMLATLTWSTPCRASRCAR